MKLNFEMYSLHLTFVCDTIIFHSLAKISLKTMEHEDIAFARISPSAQFAPTPPSISLSLSTHFAHLISHLIQNENTYKLQWHGAVVDDDDVHLHIQNRNIDCMMATGDGDTYTFFALQSLASNAVHRRTSMLHAINDLLSLFMLIVLVCMFVVAVAFGF